MSIERLSEGSREQGAERRGRIGRVPATEDGTRTVSPPRHPIRTMGWLYGWAKRIVLRRDLPRKPGRTAWFIWIATVFISLTALIIGSFLMSHDVRKATFTPIPVHLLTFLSIFIFLSVGFWMLCHDDAGTRTLGWFFTVAAFLGAVIYLASSYGYLALDEKGWRGGTTSGWLADVLFLPAIAALLPLFLTLIPTGRRHPSPWTDWAGALGVVGATLLMVALIFERHLFTHVSTPAPFAETAFSQEWAPPITIVGACFLALAVCCGFGSAWARAIHRDTSETEWHRLKWYIYGGLIGVAALLPYLMVILAPERFFPSATSWARAWGATAVAALAIAAVPSTLGEPWHSGRIKRLAWGAVFAATATVVHEFGVLSVAERIKAHPDEEIHLGPQLALTYALSLAVALAFEPAAEWFHENMIRYRSRKGSPDILLDEALRDLQSSVRCMNEAAERAETSRRRLRDVIRGWWRPADQRDPRRSRRLTRVRALERELASTVQKINEESQQASTLAARLKERMEQLQPASMTAVTVVSKGMKEGEEVLVTETTVASVQDSDSSELPI